MDNQVEFNTAKKPRSSAMKLLLVTGLGVQAIGAVLGLGFIVSQLIARF